MQQGRTYINTNLYSKMQNPFRTFIIDKPILRTNFNYGIFNCLKFPIQTGLIIIFNFDKSKHNYNMVIILSNFN